MMLDRAGHRYGTADGQNRQGEKPSSCALNLNLMRHGDLKGNGASLRDANLGGAVFIGRQASENPLPPDVAAAEPRLAVRS